ncbi:hypothetical protein TRIP_C20255 [Candidatus Zixiibacteriota bacterium]|nr:hypothetical protein TRIP_C20255 [candidate division Zixibacteria bacterium]
MTFLIKAGRYLLLFNEPLNYLKEHYNDAKKNINFIFTAGFVTTDVRFLDGECTDGDV